MILLRLLAFILGLVLVITTVASALRTFVLPRSSRDMITRAVFVGLRFLFRPWTRAIHTYEQRDRVMALYAPLGLMLLLPVWLILVTLGYAAMYWALGVESFYQDFLLSGSSLLTLGFAPVDTWPMTILAFSEAMIGLILVALLIAYLPTIYSAFSRREAAVAMLEVRAGSPPSAVEMIARFHRLHRLNQLRQLWINWEMWFSDIEESHTSLAALVFFRSPQPDRSWVTAAGTVLDAGALIASTVDVPHDPQVDLCLRAGYIALRRIADFFEIPYPTNPRPDDPISIIREEFDAAYDELAAQGVPLKPDRDEAWRHFAGWRVNYDTVLLALAALTMAPYARWSSDRSLLRPLHRSETAKISAP